MNANNHYANRNQTISSLGFLTLISMGNIQDGCTSIKFYRVTNLSSKCLLFVKNILTYCRLFTVHTVVLGI